MVEELDLEKVFEEIDLSDVDFEGIDLEEIVKKIDLNKINLKYDERA